MTFAIADEKSPEEQQDPFSWTEVNQENFTQVLPHFEKNLKKCEFVSLDLEFSGLFKPNYKPSFSETLDERYSKLRKNVQKFSVLQVGIVLWIYNPSTKKLEAQAYNFEVLKDGFFHCETASLQFLAKNNFPFSEVFLNGIKFVNEKETNEYREYLLNPSQESFPKKDTAFLRELTQEISDWFSKASENEQKIIDKDLTGYQRKIVYVVAASWPLFPNLLIETKKGKLVVTKVSKETKQKLIEQKVSQKRGFSEVLRLISKEKKLVVGHNMLLDIMYIYQNFFDELPEQFSSFKDQLHQIFPLLLDSKYVARDRKFEKIFRQQTPLGWIFRRVVGPQFDNTPKFIESEDQQHNSNLGEKVSVVLKSGNKKEEGQSHQAAYDAFMTGVVILKLLDSLMDGNLLKLSNEETGPVQNLLKKLKEPEKLSPKERFISRLFNRVNVTNSKEFFFKVVEENRD